MTLLPTNKPTTKVVAVIQARMGSKRLPGKMSKILLGYPIIQWVLRRLKESKEVDQFVLATSVHPENDILEAEAAKLDIPTFRGDEENVLSRFIAVAKKYQADIIVRICADNPLITASEVDRVIAYYKNQRPDYAFNHIPLDGNNYVDGLGAEVFSKRILDIIEENANEKAHYEHVTRYVWDHKDTYNIKTIPAPAPFAYPYVSLDVDTLDDFLFLEDSITNGKGGQVLPESVDVKKIIEQLK